MDQQDQTPNPAPSEEPVFVASLAESRKSPDPSPAGRWSSVLSILITATLVLGPVAYLGLPEEISCWYVAAAMESRLDGNTRAEFDYLAQAQAWASDNPTYHTYQGDRKLQAEDFEGSIVDYGRAIEADRTCAPALLNRAQAFLHLRRYDDAIADSKRLVASHARGSQSWLSNYLNFLAYTQGLGKKDLDSALESVERAIKIAGQNAAMLDTRGFIHYQRGDYKSARADLDLAVKMMEDTYRAYQRTTQYVERKQHELDLEELTKHVAVLRYHRSLAYDGLNKTDQAEKDRKRVRELGFEPGEDLF